MGPPEPSAQPRWEVARREPGGPLEAEVGLDPLLAQLLRNRGIRDVARARAFLEAEQQPLGDPSLLAELPEALDRLARALDRDELIALYGDYDADGLTGLALLVKALRWCGGRVLPFVPHRALDGYGPRTEQLRRLRQDGASLLLTIDCGSSAAAEIAAATADGLDVIVTDHHLVSERLPEAIVLNPRRAESAYPDRELAGCGVAHRLAEALLRRRLAADESGARAEALLGLAALGTLADVVPLVGENRVIVRRGLCQLRAEPGPGLAALCAVAGLDAAELDPEAISFAVVPRINAPGRVDHAQPALELLLTESAEEAFELALRLDQLNLVRRRLTGEALDQAWLQLAPRGERPAALVTGDFPVGIAGLVASRLAEKLDRPAVVLCRAGDRYVGSARSIAGLNVVDALGEAAHLLDRYGGHPMAAGLSLPVERLGEFERLFEARVTSERPEPAPPVLAIDAEARPATAASWRLLELLPLLEPHGPGNPAPLLLTRGLRVLERRALAADGLRLDLEGDGVRLAAVGFGAGAAGPAVGETIDLVYRPRRRAWRGRLGVELEIVDWRPAG